MKIADFRKNAPSQFKGFSISKINSLLFASKNKAKGMYIAFNTKTGNIKEVTWASYKNNFQNDGEHILLPDLENRSEVYRFLASL